MGTYSFTKAQRLRRRADFEKLHRKGRKIHRGKFSTVYCPNGLEDSRLGVTVSKKVGGAVARNRIKRLIRERFRLRKTLFNRAYDLNIIAKQGAAGLSSQEINQTLEAIFREIPKDNHETGTIGSH